MNIRILEISNRKIAVISFNESFTIKDELEYDEAVKSQVAQGVTLIVVNFDGCKRIDSAGVGNLARTYSRMHHAGGEMRLCCLSKRVENHLALTKLLEVFRVYRSEQEAVESIKLLQRPA